jgi:hypothetical protein
LDFHQLDITSFTRRTHHSSLFGNNKAWLDAIRIISAAAENKKFRWKLRRVITPAKNTPSPPEIKRTPLFKLADSFKNLSGKSVRAVEMPAWFIVQPRPQRTIKKAKVASGVL